MAELGLEVILDASPNSLDPRALNTERQLVLQVRGLAPEDLERDFEFSPFLDLLHSVDPDAKMAVVGLFGDNPAVLQRLMGQVPEAVAGQVPKVADMRRVVCEFVKFELQKSISKRDRLMPVHPHLDTLLAEFKRAEVPLSLLK
jgi:hypothetical protein